MFKTGRKSFCLLHKIFYEFILFISSGPARLMPAFGPQTEGLARAVVQIWDSCHAYQHAYMLFRTVKRTLSNFLKPVKMLNDVSMYKA